jgi:predicted kinase
MSDVGRDTVATLHFLSGKLASGKTTLARRIAEEHHAILISEDLWLSRLYPDATFDFPTYLKHSAELRTALAPHLVDVLRHGASVVLDFAGNTPRNRAWVRSIFEAAPAPHVLHYIDASDAVCKARLGQRNAALPEGSQHTTDEEFDAITAYFVPPALSEGFIVREYSDDR